MFGGFLGSSWSNIKGGLTAGPSEKANIPCSRAFLFSLIRVEDPNGRPARFMVNTQQEFAGGAWSDCGPMFGINKTVGTCDLFIADECNKTDANYSQLGYAYPHLGFGSPHCLTSGTRNFTVSEIEVFQWPTP